MKFHEYMQTAIDRAGSQKKLATLIGVRESHMSEMARAERPIPAEALLKMALLMRDGTTPGQLWEAQNEARATSEETRSLWRPFVQGAAHVGRGAVAVAALLIGTHFVSPTPAKPAPMLALSGDRLFIM